MLQRYQLEFRKKNAKKVRLYCGGATRSRAEEHSEQVKLPLAKLFSLESRTLHINSYDHI
jgi:hypothetical protein